jgi:membrane protein DedA with SNARE-associated domain
MALILLLLSRQFAELNWVTFLALLLANLVVIKPILPKKITLSIYGALIVLSIGSVAQQEFFIVNTPYFGE